MTSAQSTTPRTTRTVVTAQAVVTTAATGQLVCTCLSFRTAVSLWGEGYCTHVRQANPISASTEGKAQ